jgi:ribosomal-protein-alanine N-acetyltransferase
MKTLETERLTLRLFTPEDEAIHQVVFSDSEVCHFYCRNTRTLDQVREWLVYRHSQAKQEDLGFLAVVRRHDQALIGLVALQPYVSSWIVWEDAPESQLHTLEVELSYAFGRAYQRQGYAKEACRALLEYAFRELKLPRIANGVDGANIASCNLMKSLGFHLGKNLHPDGGTDVIGILENTLLR